MSGGGGDFNGGEVGDALAAPVGQLLHPHDVAGVVDALAVDRVGRLGGRRRLQEVVERLRAERFELLRGHGRSGELRGASWGDA